MFQICDKQFNDSKYLNVHLKDVHFIDTGPVPDIEKKYMCNICGRRYNFQI